MLPPGRSAAVRDRCTQAFGRHQPYSGERGDFRVGRIGTASQLEQPVGGDAGLLRQSRPRCHHLANPSRKPVIALGNAAGNRVVRCISSSFNRGLVKRVFGERL